MPEGSRVRGRIAASPWRQGMTGLPVVLDSGGHGFVDALSLPRSADEWPSEGDSLEFEVLQHRVGQVRLWPLNPAHHNAEHHWRVAPHEWEIVKTRLPLGSVVQGTVTQAFTSNQEAAVRLYDIDGTECWEAVASWAADQPPAVGATSNYVVTALLDTTQRVLIAATA